MSHITQGALTVLLGATLLLAQSVRQTRIAPLQIQGVPSTAGQIILTLPTGQVVAADLGSGLVIDTTGSRPVLRAVSAAVGGSHVYGEIVSPDVSGRFRPASRPVANSVRLHVNGIRLSKGEFDLLGDTVQIGFWLTDPDAIAVQRAQLWTVDYDLP
jgi:hypothetical protein